MNSSFLDLIPKGKDSARGCKELAAVTGMTEKQVRATIKARINTAAEALRAAENEIKRRSGYGNNN